MMAVRIEKRLPVGSHLPNVCTNPSHGVCFICCDHGGYRHRVIDAYPSAGRPSKIKVQCEGCGAHGDVDGEDLEEYLT